MFFTYSSDPSNLRLDVDKFGNDVRNDVVGNDVEDDDGGRTPTNNVGVDKKDRRLTLFDVIGKDRELTEMSASTTMTALDVGSTPTSPIREDNRSEILESILSLGEQLRVYGADFSDLRARLSQVETSLCHPERQLEKDILEESTIKNPDKGILLKVNFVLNHLRL